MANRKAGGDVGNEKATLDPTDSRAAATGSADEKRGLVLLNQLLSTLWMPGGRFDDRGMEAAMVALARLAPRDEQERMLAAQMIATHAAAMECLRRAMIDEQTFEGRDQNLKHSAKLLGVYTRQVEALDKHRGKGQQKITVEHVTVNAGGQAVVGNVERRAAAASAEPLALSNDPSPLAPKVDAATIANPRQETPAR
jgi:hypothetical protein